MAVKYVITVHGINSDGEWQTHVGNVLNYHFEVVPVHYSEYRHLGVLRLVVEPSLLIAGLVVLLLAVLIPVAGPWMIASGLLLIFVALVAALVRRFFMVRWFKSEIDPLFRCGRVYAIAHSFGTFLLGAAIKTWPDLRFERIVLTGCVLPRRFPWQRVLRSNPESFRGIRNEVGRKDPVVWLLYLLRWIPGLLPGLGFAGVTGFKEIEGLVHQTARPYGPCDKCEETGSEPRIHNVEIPEFTHSDAFIGAGHARTFWLPFLWGIDPGEYKKFADMCALALDLEEQNDWLDLRKVESEFRQRPWTWTGGMSVESLIAAHLALGGIDSPKAIDAVVPLVWRMVESASRETLQDKGMQRADQIRALHPRTAILRAIHARPWS
jgi:hypothetical protein